MIDWYWELFSNYIKENYDLNDKLILAKYEHTKRVANLMVLLANRLNLDSNEMCLAYLIGLFHDLGRFYEATEFKAFKNISFDHANYSNKILFEDNFIEKFNIPDSLYEIIKKAVYYHNKKELVDDLKPLEELFCKMIRDIDKIDIIRVVSELYEEEFTTTPKFELMDLYLNNKPIDLRLIDNKSERTLLRLSFMKNLYFDKSKDILEKTGNINRYLSKVKVSLELQELFDFLVSKINEEEKEKKYVRD